MNTQPKYIPIGETNPHVENLIKWLIEEVLSVGGDGDGIWYSKYFSVHDIKKFIETRQLLPPPMSEWKIEYDENNLNTFVISCWPESTLIITNDKNEFDLMPSWQQVSIVW